MRSAMFDYVKAMNVAFGNPEGRPTDYGPVSESLSGFNETAWMRLQKQCENIAGNATSIRGEVRELLNAIEARDIYNVRDALCDIMVFVLGAYHFIGYEADADMQAVLDGVMTRFCRNQAELDATLDKWAKRGITDVYTQGVFPRLCVKAASDQQDTVDGEFIPKNKFLKSVGYREPVLPPAPVPGQRRFLGSQAAEPEGGPQRRKDDESARQHG